MNQYRLHTEDDQAQFYQLYLYAFGQTDSPRRADFFNRRYNHALTYGLKDNGRIVSGLYSLPFTVNFHGATYKMNGIGDVMSAPEFSGRGGASTMMTAALEDMYADGVTLSYLAPFAYSYYRRFGYEQVFEHAVTSIASRDIPRLKPQSEGGSLSRGPLATQLDAIKAVHAASQQVQRGGVQREDWWWDYLCVKNNWDAAVYRDATGAVTGYLIYQRGDGKMIVKEFIATTPIAQQQLLGFVLKHANTYQELIYEAPSRDYLGDYFPDPYSVHVDVQPYMMARIVNLADFVAKYPLALPNGLSVTLTITDDVLPQNAGTWTLSTHDGHLQLAPGNAEGAANLTIQQLTKILFGAQRASVLQQRGQIDAAVDQAAVLDAIQPTQTPALVDYF